MLSLGHWRVDQALQRRPPPRAFVLVRRLVGELRANLHYAYRPVRVYHPARVVQDRHAVCLRIVAVRPEKVSVCKQSIGRVIVVPLYCLSIMYMYIYVYMYKP